MNNDQTLWLGIADEIGDIALPEPSEFKDEKFREQFSNMLSTLEYFRTCSLSYAKFETGEACLQVTNYENLKLPNVGGDCGIDAEPLDPQPVDGNGDPVDPARIGADGCADGSPVYMPKPDTCDGCKHRPHFSGECIVGDEACDCPDGPDMPDDLGDFGGTDYPDLPGGADYYSKDPSDPTGEYKEPSDAPDSTVIGKSQEWLQGVADYAREHGLVAGKDYVPENGIPGRDFDPNKKPMLLPRSHPDYIPF